MKNKILITGSKGFVARQLIPLLGQKYEVVGITEDVLDVEKLRPYFKDADFVIHLAVKKDDGNECYKIVIEGTKNVASLCQEYGCKLVNFSSECAGTNPNSPYAVGKMEAEKFLGKYVDNGLKAISLRPCGIVDQNWFDSSGNKLNIFRGRSYPIGRLCKNIEKIIENYDFKNYKVYKTYLPFAKMLYLMGRVYRAIKRRI